MELNIGATINSVLTYVNQRSLMVTSGAMTRLQLEELVVSQVAICIAHIRSASKIHPREQSNECQQPVQLFI